MNRQTLGAWLATIATMSLTACGSAAPTQIASYPAEPPAGPRAIAREPYRRGEVITYNADYELTVGDVDTAAGKVTQLAYDLGGYVSSSQSWTQDNQKNITMELIVPSDQYDSLHRRLVEIGTINADRVSNEVISPEDANGRTTMVTIRLQPSSFAISSDGSWNPARTFANASSVIASIFHVLADISIWIVVVIGPFAIIGLLVWFLVRRSRRTLPPQV